MKTPSARQLRGNADHRLRLHGEPKRRNPYYLRFYDLYLRILRYRATAGSEMVEDSLTDEAWNLIKDYPWFCNASRQEGNPLRGRLYLAKEYIGRVFTECFSLRFAANPNDPLLGGTVGPEETGATVTFDGKTIAGLVYMIFPDEGEVPTGQGMIVNLRSADKFLISYDTNDWRLLASQDKGSCVCLDVNVQYRNLGDHMADFRLLLPTIKAVVLKHSTHGRLQPNNILLYHYKHALSTKLSMCTDRKSGGEIKRWFEAYDLSLWGMSFDNALKKYGYIGVLDRAGIDGLSIQEIATRLYPKQWGSTSRKSTSEEQEKITERAREYFRLDHTVMSKKGGLAWAEAEKKAAQDLGIDLRPPSVKRKKLTQKVRDYIGNAGVLVAAAHRNAPPIISRLK